MATEDIDRIQQPARRRTARPGMEDDDDVSAVQPPSASGAVVEQNTPVAPSSPIRSVNSREIPMKEASNDSKATSPGAIAVNDEVKQSVKQSSGPAATVETSPPPPNEDREQRESQKLRMAPAVDSGYDMTAATASRQTGEQADPGDDSP